VGGAWRTFDTGSYPILSDGTATAYLLNTSRGRYRVRTIFPGDTDPPRRQITLALPESHIA
jgi:hypothetical protein